MNTYKTPGVFLEEIAKLPPSVAPSATAIPAFIGHTYLSNKDAAGIHPVRISSMLEYEQLFGTSVPGTFTISIFDTITDGRLTGRTVQPVSNSGEVLYLYYYLQIYFANGGGPCYIVPATGGKDYAVTEADLLAGIAAAEKMEEVTLLVLPTAFLLPMVYNEEVMAAEEAMNEAEEAGDYDLYNQANLAYEKAVVKSQAMSVNKVYTAALEQCARLKNRFTIIDCAYSVNAIRNEAYGLYSEHMAYGAAYYPALKTSLPYVQSDQNIFIYYAQNGYAMVTGRLSDHPDVYDEVFQIARQAALSFTVMLSPSAAIAGVYASVDRDRGVWKAPANTGLNMVTGTAVEINDADQADLNIDPVAGKSINAIRNFSGKGTLVWGARTLARNDNEWRYISVRRLFNMVEADIKKTVQHFVFENNDANTWVKLRGAIDNYLVTLWRDGALQGAKPQDAFYIAAGLGQTMTAQDVLEGRLIVEVGIAAVRPAEFIILRFSHMMAQS